MRVYELVWDVSISIHALLAESDLRATCGPTGGRTFLSTLSLRRATLVNAHNSPNNQISIHALLAESDITGLGVGLYLVTISIHALLAESDLFKILVESQRNNDFYPRSPCGERHSSNKNLTQVHHFYPRSPCGERPLAPKQNTTQQRISIHALLAESD